MTTPNQPSPIKPLLDFEDALTDVQYWAIRAKDYHEARRMADDNESAVEAVVFMDMHSCGCPCCRRHLPRLLRAEEFDQAERENGDGAERGNTEIADSVRPIHTAYEAVRIWGVQVTGMRAAFESEVA